MKIIRRCAVCGHLTGYLWSLVFMNEDHRWSITHPTWCKGCFWDSVHNAPL